MCVFIHYFYTVLYVRSYCVCTNRTNGKPHFNCTTHANKMQKYRENVQLRLPKWFLQFEQSALVLPLVSNKQDHYHGASSTCSFSHHQGLDFYHKKMPQSFEIHAYRQT